MFKGVKFRKINFVLRIVETLLIIAIAVWNMMKLEKMGIVRHITFWNTYKFPKLLTDNVILVVFGLLGLLLLAQLIYVVKVKKNYSYVAFNALILIASYYYTKTYNVDKEFIYYYIVVFCILINIIQNLKFLTLDFSNNKNS